ncbi:hypothetical protein [Rubricoccus marinus]|uniref:hypothetical protein n=1 Tax=Rubricoccus marinus TaxID=716817 RepID=UPI00117AEFC5|nr:hypothetical protein [Rubricoccus marinus]
MDAPLYSCLTKASNRESGVPRASANWVVSRRGRFVVFPDRIRVGDWVIPFEEVSHAVLYRIPYLPFVDASVLELSDGETTYQFGFNPWAHPERHFPIPVEERRETMRYSAFSVGIRVAAVAYGLYLIWEWAT